MYSDDEEVELALEVTKEGSAKLPPICHGQREAIVPLVGSSRTAITTGISTSLGVRQRTPSIVQSHYDLRHKRLYIGLDNGVLAFWALPASAGVGASGSMLSRHAQYVGHHTGPISSITTCFKVTGALGRAGLVVSGGVDTSLKIWDYIGRVTMDPSVCVQTLYGHGGTVTSVVALGEHIISGSTDGSIRVWRAEEGRTALKYPWFELQTTISAMDGWVRSMSYDCSRNVGDWGAVFAADESGGILEMRLQPQWDERVQRVSESRLEVYAASKAARLHDRGVSSVRYVAAWQAVITISYDQCIRVFDLLHAGPGSGSGSGSGPSPSPFSTGSHSVAPVPSAGSPPPSSGAGGAAGGAGGKGGLGSGSGGASSIREGDFTLRCSWVSEQGAVFRAVEVEEELEEILACDSNGVLSIFSTKTGRLLATKVVVKPTAAAMAYNRRQAGVGAGQSGGLGGVGGPTDIFSITKIAGRHYYAICTATDVTVWHVNHDLPYNVNRGGHEGPVIQLYSCSGGVPGTNGDLDFRLFSAGQDMTVRIWDPYDMACLRVLEVEQGLSEITAMTYYEGWNIVVTGHDNGVIRLWNLDTGTCQSLKQHRNSIQALEIAPLLRNDLLLISTGYDGWVVLWDIRSLRGEEPHVVAKFRTYGSAVDAAQHDSLSGEPSGPSPLGHGSIGGGRKFSKVEREAEASKRSLKDARRISMSGEGEPSPEKTVESVIGALNCNDTFVCTRPPVPMELEVLALKYDPYKKVILTGGTDKRIKVWSGKTFDYLGRHVGHTEAVTCLTLDSNFLFSGSDDATICLWDTVPARPGAALSDGSRSFNSSALSWITESGLGLDSDSADGDSGLFGASQQRSPHRPFLSHPLKVLTGHEGSVSGLDILAGSGHLASSSLDGTIRIWDYATGEALHTFKNPGQEFLCMALRHDRPEMVVGTNQGEILRYLIKQEVMQQLEDAQVEELPAPTQAVSPGKSRQAFRSQMSSSSLRNAATGSSGGASSSPVTPSPDPRAGAAAAGGNVQASLTDAASPPPAGAKKSASSSSLDLVPDPATVFKPPSKTAAEEKGLPAAGRTGVRSKAAQGKTLAAAAAGGLGSSSQVTATRIRAGAATAAGPVVGNGLGTLVAGGGRGERTARRPAVALGNSLRQNPPSAVSRAAALSINDVAT